MFGKNIDFFSKFPYSVSGVQMYMYLVFSNSVIRNKIFLFHSYFNFRSVLKRSDPCSLMWHRKGLR